MKKALAILLSVMMVATLLASPVAFAEPNADIEIEVKTSATTARPGGTITVTASLKENAGFGSIVLSPYLGAGLTFDKWVAGSVANMDYYFYKGDDGDTTNPTAENAAITYGADTQAAENFTGTGDLVSFTAVVGEAVAADTILTVGFKFQQGSKANEDPVAAKKAEVTTSVTVKNGIPGDLNHDESVDEDDAIYLLMYTVFPDDYPIDDPDLCDYNHDESVDEDDAIYLLMYTVFPDDYPI